MPTESISIRNGLHDKQNLPFTVMGRTVSLQSKTPSPYVQSTVTILFILRNFTIKINLTIINSCP